MAETVDRVVKSSLFLYTILKICVANKYLGFGSVSDLIRLVRSLSIFTGVASLSFPLMQTFPSEFHGGGCTGVLHMLPVDIYKQH